MFEFFRKSREEYSIGKTLFLGNYPQKDCEDNSPIEWRILDISKEVALLISEYAIISSGYCYPDEGFKGMEWINSLARKVCNNDFYNTAFSESDKHIICKRTTEQISISNPAKNISCEDNVFILSEKEATIYMPDLEKRIAYPTEYTKAVSDKVKWCTIDESIPWWLMPHYDIGGTVTDSTGEVYSVYISPKAVNQKGEIHHHSRCVYHTDFAIRPCIQIDLKAYKKLG